MGQKVNPIGIRLGISRDHNSVWYAEKNKYQQLLLNDFAVREFLKKRLDNSFVSKIEIENIWRKVLTLAKLETGSLTLPLAKNSLKPEISISLVSIIIAAITS